MFKPLAPRVAPSALPRSGRYTGKANEESSAAAPHAATRALEPRPPMPGGSKRPPVTADRVDAVLTPPPAVLGIPEAEFTPRSARRGHEPDGRGRRRCCRELSLTRARLDDSAEKAADQDRHAAAARTAAPLCASRRAISPWPAATTPGLADLFRPESPGNGPTTTYGHAAGDAVPGSISPQRC